MTEQPAVVLLAEDEPLASMALQAQVEALGHVVAGVARNGREAADLARCLPVDLAILDMKMPGMTGLEAALQVFPEAPVPVLLLTGFGAADLPDPVPEPPVFALLTKPVGLVELKEGIARARTRFRAWSEAGGEDSRVRQAREERRDIARALARVAGDQTEAAAAATLLARAQAESTSAVDMARRILRSDAGD